MAAAVVGTIDFLHLSCVSAGRYHADTEEIVCRRPRARPDVMRRVNATCIDINTKAFHRVNSFRRRRR